MHDVDHFLCYQAKAERKRPDGTSAPRVPQGMQVEVADQFQARRYDLKKVSKLCTPVAKGEDPSDPSRLLSGSGGAMPVAPASRRHPERVLVCYKAKLARKLIPQVDGPDGPGTGCGPAASAPAPRSPSRARRRSAASS